MINRSIIKVIRSQATEYILKNFYYDQSIIEYHFDLLLKQICINNDWNFQYQLSDIMNNELNDEDLNKILFQNTNQYTTCERLKLIF